MTDGKAKRSSRGRDRGLLLFDGTATDDPFNGEGQADAYLLINAFHFHQAEDYRMLAAIGQAKSANYSTVELCLLFVLFVIGVGRESGDLPAPFYVCGARAD